MNNSELKRRVATELGMFEMLESRQMLSADMPRDVVGVMHQDVWDVAYDAARGNTNELVTQGAARVDSEGRVQTYVNGDPPSRIVTELQSLGGVKIDSQDDIGKRVQCWIPAIEVDDAARLAGVSEVMLPDYFHVNTVTSAGDSILKADKVRAQFAGIDGTGIKVGVISDGANDAASVASELGNYTVVQTGSGNEGTAMMEIVHDLAPGAQLFFYGPSTSVDMVNGVNYLANTAHCNVIVDDLSFFGEGDFQDTSVAAAAQNAVNNNVVYVTSAGNYSDQQHWQGSFTGNQPGFEGGSSRLLNWSGLNTVNNQITVPNGATFRAFLQWSDPFNASANDYDLYLIDDTFSIVKSSKNVQSGSQSPFETITYTNNTGSNKTLYLNVDKKPTAVARTLELFTYNNSSMQYSTTGDALIGQEAVTGVMSVAAENAGSNSVAIYSSRGGSTIFTDMSNNQISTVRQTLDGTGTDGVHTAIGAGAWKNDPFYGTSAAAPHAAAIAALVRAVNPSLTPAQVTQIMADTATDFTAYGVGYDTTSGAGLYNALDAAYKAYTPSAVDLVAASDSGLSSTDNITNDSTPTFTGTVPAASYVTIYVDGVANQSMQLGAGVTTYNLTTSALSNATHAITIKVASSSAVLASNFSNASASLNVTIDTLAPAMPGTPDLTAASDSGASSTDNVTNINTPTFTGSAEAGSTVTLFGNGSTIGSGTSNGSFSIQTSSLADANYSITAQAMDTAGNLSPVSAALNPVKIDTTAPTISPPTYDPNLAAMTVKVQFSEDVSLSLSNSTLKLQDIHTSQLLPAVNQAFSYNAATNTASFTFIPGYPSKGILPDGDYQAAMYGNFVSDLAGNHPSSDGTVNFFFYQADANFDRTINALDFNALATNFGGPNKTYAQGDFNYDGTVSTLDFAILATKFNQTLPLPSPPLGGAVVQAVQPASATPVESLFNDVRKIGTIEDLVA